MLIAGAVIGGIIGGLSSSLGVGSQNKALTKAFKQQMKIVMQNYNYNQNALDQEQRYALDNAKQQLFSLTLNGMQNNSTVEAALAETGYEGRTAGKVKQSIAGTAERQRTAKIDNYYLQTDQIRAQKDTLYIQTKNSIEQARKSLEAQYTGGLQALGQVVQGAATGAMMGAFAEGVGSSMLGSAGAPGVTSTGAGLSFTEAVNANLVDWAGNMFKFGSFAMQASNSLFGGNRRIPTYSFNY